MLSALLQPDIWASFLTLSVLEIVLGIDNIIFLSLVCAKLPKPKQPQARMIGLALALVMRIGLLACIAWLAKMNKTIFSVMGQDISWRDIILAGGGLFLLYKATIEIHREVEGEEEDEDHKHKETMLSVILQIVAIDLVLSLDSIFTAVGVADHLPVMIAAIVVAILIMLFASNPVADFVEEHPTVKMLALAFILLVGIVLVADALEFHIPRGYLYFGIFFSLSVEGLNQLVHRNRHKKAGGGH